jgi:hypothetical protein
LGNGLCHGISGNGYFIHCLYRTYKRLADQEKCEWKANVLKEIAKTWELRTFIYAKAIFDPKTQNQMPDKFKPVYPFSLMEGISGVISFLSDLLQNEDEVRFPGYEI